MLDFLKKEARKLDRNDAIPMYYQIKQQLKAAIETHELKPGESFPSERELIDLYGVSRPTVRQATEDLLNEGYLFRRKGLGTFVSQPRLQEKLPNALGFTERMEREGRNPASRVVSSGIVEARDEKVIERLGVLAGSAVFQLKRLRLADNEPVMLETTHLPLAFFPALPETDFNKISLYQFLHEKYNVAIARLRETLEPVSLRETDSRLLEVAKGSPAMRVEIVAFGAEGQPIEYSQALVRGDRCQYYLEVETDHSGEPIAARVIHNHLDLSYGDLK